MTGIKKQIFNYVHEATTQMLYAHDYRNLGIHAAQIAEAFFIDRSNASRILNQLFHDGCLCKMVGRPTLYLSSDAIDKVFPNNTVPKIISSSSHIEQFLLTRKPSKEKSYMFSFQFQDIGYSDHEAMYEPMKKVEKILLYPDHNKLLFFNGSPSLQKTSFISHILQYLYAVGSLSKTCEPLSIEWYPDFDFAPIQASRLKNKNQNVLICNIKKAMTTSDLEEFQLLLKQKLLRSSTAMIILVDLQMTSCSDYTNALYPIINIPQYFDFSAKEKIEYVFSFIHQEANMIHKTLSFTKNLVCCLVLCNMIGSLDNLKNLIHLTCINAYDNMVKSDHELALTLDDLPSEILSGIEGTTAYMEQINQVFQLFDYTLFYAFPQMEFMELNTLLQSVINESQEIIRYQKEEANSVLIAVKHDIESFHKLYYDETIEQNPMYTNLASAVDALSLLQQPYNTILTHHLYQAVDTIRNGNYKEKSVLHDRLEYTLFSKECEQLFDVLEQLLKKNLPIYERIYINTFIMHCQHMMNKSKIGIIFCLSDQRLSQVYKTTVNQRYGEDFAKASSISFSDFYHAYDENYHTFQTELSALDSPEGIIILTDTYLPFNLIHKLKADITSKIKITTNLSDMQLHKIHDMYLDDQIDFDAFQPSEYLIENMDTGLHYDETHNLMEVLNQALQHQLSFLDSYKIVPLLQSAFYSIIHDLSVEYTNNLLITFLMHAGFLLERTIKNESFPYKSLNKLQRQNRKIYNVVYQNFKSVESYFNFKIKETELAYIVEIFVDAMQSEKTTS